MLAIWSIASSLLLIQSSVRNSVLEHFDRKVLLIGRRLWQVKSGPDHYCMETNNIPPALHRSYWVLVIVRSGVLWSCFGELRGPAFSPSELGPLTSGMSTKLALTCAWGELCDAASSSSLSAALSFFADFALLCKEYIELQTHSLDRWLCLYEVRVITLRLEESSSSRPGHIIIVCTMSLPAMQDQISMIVSLIATQSRR